MHRNGNAAPRLEMCAISKTFGPVRALRDVTLTAHAGEVHALMGENGAGKSTLMKILSGAHRPDPGGAVHLDGVALPPGDPRTARDRGIAVIYQELALAPNLSVARNMFLGRELRRGALADAAEMTRRAGAILDRLGVRFGPRALVADLSLGERQMVEIARALTGDLRVLVMDEPTTSLSTKETDRLFEGIAGLKRDGIAILYISHRMDEVYALSDRCTVLRDGATVGTLTRDQLDAATLVQLMVGRDLSSFYTKEHRPTTGPRSVALQVNGLGDGHRVRDCSFQVHRGEVLGIAGLVGSGRTELLRLIFGADPATTGTMVLNGQPVEIRAPRAALDAGIAYLTEDRKGLGLFLDMSIRDNISMAVAHRDAGGLLRRNPGRARDRAKAAIRSLGIRTPSAAQTVGALSGGNQQKVLLARLLETAPSVLLLDEPTRGVDIGAKSEIYRLIDRLAEAGMAVVLVSSELPEIIGTADRCLVMREGRIAGEITAGPGRPITQDAIMAISTGVVRVGAAEEKGQ